MIQNISLIVACSYNKCIGINNDLPWHIPGDLKMFKQLTSNNIVIMGRKCWDSLPIRFKPLPNRRCIVITKNPDFNECEHYSSIEECLTILKEDENIFIIGGGQIYKYCLENCLINTVYLTEVQTIINGDTFLESFDESLFVLESESEVFNENGYEYVFKKYLKKT